jgi:hypothetical protein
MRHQPLESAPLHTCCREEGKSTLRKGTNHSSLSTAQQIEGKTESVVPRSAAFSTPVLFHSSIGFAFPYPEKITY